MPAHPKTITVKIRTEQAGEDLAQVCEWALNDMAYTAPEDYERQSKCWGAVARAVKDYRAAVGIDGADGYVKRAGA